MQHKRRHPLSPYAFLQRRPIKRKLSAELKRDLTCNEVKAHKHRPPLSREAMKKFAAFLCKALPPRTRPVLWTFHPALRFIESLSELADFAEGKGVLIDELRDTREDWEECNYCVIDELVCGHAGLVLMIALALLEMWEKYEYCLQIMCKCKPFFLQDYSVYDGMIRDYVKAIRKTRNRAIFERSIGLQID
jgi:hypothetical protein